MNGVYNRDNDETSDNRYNVIYNRKNIQNELKSNTIGITQFTIVVMLFTIGKLQCIRDNRCNVIYNRDSVYFSRPFFTIGMIAFTIVKIIISPESRPSRVCEPSLRLVLMFGRDRGSTVKRGKRKQLFHTPFVLMFCGSTHCANEK